MGTVFDLLFAALTMLLIFSTGIIIYSSLFASQESAFLLTTPVPADHVFSYKLQGAIAFSSWGFVLLGSPVLIAYGMVVRRRGLDLLSEPAAVFPGLHPDSRHSGGPLTLIIVNLVPARSQAAVVGHAAGRCWCPWAVHLALDRHGPQCPVRYARLVLDHL